MELHQIQTLVDPSVFEVDLATEIDITVAEIDVENGIRCKSAECPLALAMIRAGLREPAVAVCDASFMYGDTRLEFDLPPQVINFITRFDMGKTVDLPSFSITPNMLREFQGEDNDSD